MRVRRAALAKPVRDEGVDRPLDRAHLEPANICSITSVTNQHAFRIRSTSSASLHARRPMTMLPAADGAQPAALSASARAKIR